MEVSDMSGKKTTLKTIIKPGKVAAVYFFSINNPDCRKELEFICKNVQRWQKAVPFDMVLMTIDDRKHNETIKKFLTWNLCTMPVYYFDCINDYKANYAWGDLPYMVFLDKDHLVRMARNGIDRKSPLSNDWLKFMKQYNEETKE